MSTIRARDAADWAVLVPEDEADEDMVAMFDVHALLAAGDALAAVAQDSSAGSAGYVLRLARSAAIAAWKAATG